MNGASDARDAGHHFLAWSALAGIAQRKIDACGGGCDRGEAGLFKDAGAGHIPRIRQDEDARSAMKLPELDRFVGLGFHTSLCFVSQACFQQGQLPRALSRMRLMKLGTCTTARPTVPRPTS